MGPTEFTIRRAEAGDAARLTRIHLDARLEAMPPTIHPQHEVLEWVAGNIERDEVWVVDVAGEPAAYLRLTEAFLDDLYVHPDHKRSGIGTALLELAKTRMPDGFQLWVFEMNEPARAFYARHGLVEVERTDGADNEEKMPDIRMEWPGS